MFGISQDFKRIRVSLVSMKSVFVAGSRRKSYRKINDLVQLLNDSGISATTAGKSEDVCNDTKESEQNSLLNAFRKIDESDVCYVFSTDGYIGRTVSVEIAYAHAKEKELISSEKLGIISTSVPISKVMNSEELIKYCSSSE